MPLHIASGPASAITEREPRTIVGTGERDGQSSSNISPVGQAPLVIVVAPVRERPGAFSARLRERTICRATNTPLLDAARVLLDEGHDPTTVLEMWREGATEFALRAQLGAAEKLTVEESAHGPVFRTHRKASRGAVGAPGIAPNVPAAATTVAEPVADAQLDAATARAAR